LGRFDAEVLGFLKDGKRRRLKRLKTESVFANSDLSGISIFEEAQYLASKRPKRC